MLSLAKLHMQPRWIEQEQFWSPPDLPLGQLGTVIMTGRGSGGDTKGIGVNMLLGTEEKGEGREDSYLLAGPILMW